MSAQAAFANLAWLAASLPAHRRFVAALRAPEATQDRWLRRHLRSHADTAYGRSVGAGEIRSYAEFTRRVPLLSSDELAPWVDRIRQGETGVLTREPVQRLMPTSGSTTARKLIPFTLGLQREFNAATGPWLVDLALRTPSLVLGPAYWSVTPMGAPRQDEPSAVPIGFARDSEYLGGARAWLVDHAMAVPSSAGQIHDLDTFRRTVLEHLLRRGDLRMISVWHPSFLTLLLDTLIHTWDQLIAALGAQGFGRRVRALQRADPVQPSSIWPHLRLVSCWGDAHAAAALADLARRLPGVTVQPKGLLATEAFVSLPFGEAHPIALCSHFFEFADAAGRVHPVHALRSGETYELIVTTGGGLWRYRLGDRVTVTGSIEHTPSIRFVGRSGIVSDRCGEKLSEAFAAQVLADLLPEARFSLLAPEAVDGRWRYVLFAEVTSGPPRAEPLDAALSANPHYALCRRLGQLAPPVIVRLAGEGYQRYAQAEAARGCRLGDIKPAPLSTRTDWSRQFASVIVTSD